MMIKAVILTHTGATDQVYIHTDLPSSFPPEVNDNQPLIMHFEVQATKGIEYVKSNFRVIPIEVIDLRTGERTHVS